MSTTATSIKVTLSVLTAAKYLPSGDHIIRMGPNIADTRVSCMYKLYKEQNPYDCLLFIDEYFAMLFAHGFLKMDRTWMLADGTRRVFAMY